MWSSSYSKKLKRALALAALCLAAGASHAASWRDELAQASAIGQGSMRWMGFQIYQATLWAAQRPFQPERPFALQLQYARTISGERLVQASLDEIERLRMAPRDAATLERWRALLLRAFPDVKPGDELIGVYLPGRGMRLYDRQRLLAEIEDHALAQAFFAIWLDARTREPGLRRQLLGETP